MVAYNFKKQFAPLVRSRLKRQTIRPPRKRHARPGEFIQLYWGMRTKMCEKLLSDALCLSVEPIEILQPLREIYVVMGSHALLPSELHKLAIADGFQNRYEFLEFFQTTHGFPFTGVLIKWE